MSEELKPCPFCGKPGRTWIDYGAIVYGCSDYDNCTRPRPTNELKESWNNAYCWKEIKALESKLAEKEKQLENWIEETRLVEVNKCYWKDKCRALESSLANKSEKKASDMLAEWFIDASMHNRVSEFIEKALLSVREEALAEGEAKGRSEAIRECADIFPTNWIDSRMQALEIPAGCPQIEGLLLHLKSEVLKLLTSTKEIKRRTK